MAVDFSQDSSFAITRPPRRIIATDTRGGCPATSQPNDRLMTATISLANPAIVSVQSQIIRRRSSPERCDTQLYGVGTPNVSSDTQTGTVVLMRFLSFNDQFSGEWDTHYNCWMGTVPAGTHTFFVDNVSGGCRDFYGCGTDWGQMHFMIFE
jgi:hypothetical protein